MIGAGADWQGGGGHFFRMPPQPWVQKKIHYVLVIRSVHLFIVGTFKGVMLRRAPRSFSFFTTHDSSIEFVVYFVLLLVEKLLFFLTQIYKNIYYVCFCLVNQNTRTHAHISSIIDPPPWGINASGI